jgi:outer membrane protein OmpA-like peptidoglycan-associated protein/tetratricopeptide (TPR) repeat protein
MLIYSPPYWTFLVLLSLAWLPNTTAYSQTSRAFERAGDAAIKRKDYSSAFVYYGNVIHKSPHKIGVQWKYAESARQFYALDLAEKAYKVVVADAKGVSKYPLAWYRLGEIAQMKGDYDRAASCYSRYQTLENADTTMVRKAAREAAACNWAKNAEDEPASVEIKHLDKKINSPYSDMAPVGRGDTLFFSSYRFQVFDKKTKEHQRQTRLMVSVGGKSAREPLRGIPTGDSAHIAHTAFTPDGNFLIFNYCKNINPTEIRCELWMVNKDIKGHWTKPRRLPEPVNMSGYTTTQPSIAYDAANKDLRLWFASDRPGGKGKNDIWYVSLDADWFCPCNLPFNARKPQRLPEFSAPKHVAEINTEEQEATPYYHTATGELYFSSEGWTGFGGYDVFKSQEKKKRFEKPENVGIGINSSYNDIYFSLRADGSSGYLSSNRPGSFYLDERNKACCNDIYEVKIPQLTPPVTLVPKDPQLPTIPVTPVVPTPVPAPTPPDFKDFTGLPLFFDNDEPDKRTRKTVTQKTYEETVVTYLARQDEYRNHIREGLKDAAEENAEKSVDAFFDTEVRAGFERLTQLCELLQLRLGEGQKVEIIIKGFTSPRAQNDYNLNLSKRRISSVRNHIAAWSGGALHTYINNGQLLITEAGFGESKAKSGLSDNLFDVRNSVYSPDVARERRVEIVEIKAK